jgi:hypothetical protein
MLTGHSEKEYVNGKIRDASVGHYTVKNDLEREICSSGVDSLFSA